MAGKGAAFAVRLPAAIPARPLGTHL